MSVNKSAGFSAAALVQRFGSKRALLLATAADAGCGSKYIFAGLRAQHRSPVAALLGMADCMTMMGSTREAVANTLAFLPLDLTDRDVRRHALAGSRGMHRGPRALVKDAVAAAEIVCAMPAAWPLRCTQRSTDHGGAGRSTATERFGRMAPAGLEDGARALQTPAPAIVVQG